MNVCRTSLVFVCINREIWKSMHHVRFCGSVLYKFCCWVTIIGCSFLFVVYFYYSSTTAHYFCCGLLYYCRYRLRIWQNACSYDPLSVTKKEVVYQSLDNPPALDIPVRIQFAATFEGRSRLRIHFRSISKKMIVHGRTERPGLREAEDWNKLIGE